MEGKLWKEECQKNGMKDGRMERIKSSDKITTKVKSIQIEKGEKRGKKNTL